MTRPAALAALLLVAAGALPARPTPPDAADPLELVLCGPDGVARVRVEVTVGGVPVAKVWDEAFAKLTALYDRNGDGRLDRTEAARLPSAFSLRQVSWGRSVPHTGLPVPWAELAPAGADTVGVAEVAAYYRRAGLGGVTVTLGRTAGGPALTAALLARLDADNNGVVSEAEWKAAADRLRPLDRNEDELVGPAELVARANYPGVTGAGVLTPPQGDAGVTADSPLLLLPRDGDAGWADLLARSQTGGLPRTAAGWKEWRAGEPDVRWRVEAGPWADGRAAVLKAGGDRPGDQLVAAAGRLHLTVRSDPGRLPSAMSAARKRLTDQFSDADADRDGHVVAGEVTRRSLYELQQVLGLADRNGDGRLSNAEMTSWLDVQDAIARGHIVLAVRDHGAGLFELLDTDQDGSLSVRERRGAWDRVRAAGCAPDGRFDPTRLPHHLIGVVTRGTPVEAVVRPTRPGPEWHRGMDRNRDGDVSRREFTGPAEVFDTLDRDRDGLIDPDEAARAGPG